MVAVGALPFGGDQRVVGTRTCVLFSSPSGPNVAGGWRGGRVSHLTQHWLSP